MTKQPNSGLDALRNKRDIQKALKDSKRKKKAFKVVASTKEKFSIGIYLLVLFVLAVFKYILKIGVVFDLELLNHFLPRQIQLSEKLIEGAMTVMLILTLTKAIKVFFINSIDDTSTRFNVKRIFNLVTGIILFFIILSVLFANWYTAVVSLGLISLILGFALQIPITSFIAWIDIVITSPFKVGDRIKLGEAVGDVVDIGYLETTVWETTGEGLSTSYYTGRVIRIPNSNVLSNPIYNYSWPLFPYLFDEVKFYVGFKSDLTFTEESIKRVCQEVMGDKLLDDIHLYHELLKETPIDESQLDEKPLVYFRVHDNMWLEANLRYLVEPKDAGNLKKKIVEKVMEELLTYPEKIVIPMGGER